MKIRVCIVLVTISAFLPSAAVRLEAATIMVPTVTVDAGDLFTIPISIADGIDLTSWQFDLTFDPAVVSAESMTEGPFLASFGPTLFTPPLIIDNSLGIISGSANFFLGGPPVPSGSGVLATITFTALAPGISPLILSNVFLNLSGAGFEITPGQITVEGTPVVPEPATLVLMATGLALFGSRCRVRRQSKSGSLRRQS